MRHSMLLAGLMYFFYNGYTQNKKVVDSLVSILDVQHGSAKYKTLDRLGFEYFNGDTDSALLFFKEANLLAYQLSDSLEIVKSTRRIGQMLLRLGRVDEGIDTFNRVLLIANRNSYTADYLKILSGLGLGFAYKGMYDIGLAYFFKALHRSEASNDQFNKATALMNIAFIYYKLRDYDKALLYSLESLKKKKEINDDIDFNQLLINISLCYAYRDSFSVALQYVDEFFGRCNNCSNNLIGQGLFSKGIIYFGLNDFEKAEQFFKSSYDLMRETKDTRFQFDNIDYLTQIYVSQNKMSLAREYLLKAEELINKGGPFNLELIKIYLRFSELYFEARDFERMAYYQQKYIDLKDSIFSEELTTNLMKIESDYLEKENQTKIASQKRLIALNDEIIKRQNLLNASVSIIAVIVIILAIVLFKNNRQRKTINQLLELRVKERTEELESKRNELLRACNERDLLIEKTTQSIRSSLASIKGLYEVALKDISDPNARQYISKMNLTSEQLEFTLKNLQALGALHD